MVGPFVLQTDYRMSYNNEALDGVGRRQVKYEGVAGEDRTSGQSWNVCLFLNNQECTFWWSKVADIKYW